MAESSSGGRRGSPRFARPGTGGGGVPRFIP